MGGQEAAGRVAWSESPSRLVEVGGAAVREDSFLAALEACDREAVWRLVRQIRDDRNAGSGYSLGLELVSRAYRSRVMGYLAQLCVGNSSLAEEAWNDTLLSVYTQIDGYDWTRSAFRTWVFNQARYAVMDLQRRLARHSKHESPAGTMWSELSAGDVARLPRAVDRDAVMPEPLTVWEVRAIRRAFGRLNETQRNLVWSRFVMELDHAETARNRLVDIPEEHVRVYVNRAAHRLAVLFCEEIGVEMGKNGGSHVR